MTHFQGELSEYLAALDIPVEWFCIASIIVENQRRYPVIKLAEDAQSRGSDGIYYHGVHEIPVSARSVEEWSKVIGAMVSGGLAVIADDAYLLKHYERFYLTVAALRPDIYIRVGDVVLTELGYNYWTGFHGKDAQWVHVWDSEGSLLTFSSSKEQVTWGSCPAGYGHCPFSCESPVDCADGCLEIFADPPYQCEVKEFPFPFFLDDVHIVERGYYLKCAGYARLSPPGSPRIF
jgi:hypothetical protein